MCEKDKTSATSLPHSSGRGYSTAVGREEVNLEPAVLALRGLREKVPHFLTQFCHWDTQFTHEPWLKLTALLNRCNSADYPLLKMRQDSE